MRRKPHLRLSGPHGTDEAHGIAAAVLLSLCRLDWRLPATAAVCIVMALRPEFMALEGATQILEAIVRGRE